MDTAWADGPKHDVIIWLLHQILRAVMSELPPEGPRLVAGLQTPIEIVQVRRHVPLHGTFGLPELNGRHACVQAVELGVDLISSAFPFTLVRTGHALVFPLTEEAVNMAAEEARQARKRRRVEVSTVGSKPAAARTRGGNHKWSVLCSVA